MKLKNVPKLEQGDLLFVNLTGSSTNKQQVPGNGWLLVTEVATDGRIISANFCRQGQFGYGQVIWPMYEVKAFLRGIHGECSPFTAMLIMFSKTAAVALT